MTLPLSPLGRAALFASSAALALARPSRADLVAVVGDLSSGTTLGTLCERVGATSEGREMLRTLTPARFPEKGGETLAEYRGMAEGSLGFEYARFMDERGFEPEGRAEVRFVEDARERWVLQRYRDVHDLWHVLTGMPTSLVGEVGQKWFEAVQTGLPVAVLGALGGVGRVSSAERRVLVREVVPWAVRSGRGAVDLLAVRYEDRMEEQVTDLRREWGVEKVPVKMKGMRP
eukprot:GFKZ01001333.1.p1 GENE.GFKZ01001333.1~~GFKZ01001333.1.p1  ORF type:complete len:241 (-),score=23.84 GFKZ01001333.1:471-1163(-)